MKKIYKSIGMLGLSFLLSISLGIGSQMTFADFYQQKQYDASNVVSEYEGNTDPGSATVMIYLDGTNLEEPDMGKAEASFMMLALLNSGIDPEKTNVVVHASGSTSWVFLPGSGAYDLHLIFDTEKNDLKLDYSWDEEPTNMGSSETLSNFLNHTVEQYPADHYGLILWDHGGGPLLGCEQDEIFYGDTLTMQELSDALAASPFGPNHKLDWLGFDCCLMANLEVANVISDYAHYMIASQESELGGAGIEYGDGWVYPFIKVFNETTDPVKIGLTAIDYYAEGKYARYGDKEEYSMSLLNLDRIESVNSAVDTLFGVLEQDLIYGKFEELAQIRMAAKEFSEGKGYYVMDLGYYNWLLSELHPEETKQLDDALDQFVLYQKTNIPQANGVSIFMPEKDQARDCLSDEYMNGKVGMSLRDLEKSENYVNYLNKYMDCWQYGPENVDWIQREPVEEEAPIVEEPSEDVVEETPIVEEPSEEVIEDPTETVPVNEPIDDVITEDPKDLIPADEIEKNTNKILDPIILKDTGEGYVWRMPQEYKKNLAFCSVNILSKGTNGYYDPVLIHRKVEPDENGDVYIAKNQEIMTFAGNSDDKEYWPMSQLASYEESSKYISLNTTLEGAYGVMSGLGTDTTPVSVYVNENKQDGSLAVSKVRYRNIEGLSDGKNEADLEKYDYLAHYLPAITPSESVNGGLAPFEKWEKGAAVLAQQLSIGDGFWPEKRNTSDLSEHFYVQLVYQDVYGNETASDLKVLQSACNPEKYTEDINGISCTYELYDNYAKLINLSGSAEQFTIPSVVNGHTVTKIGYAVLDGAEISQLTVPGTIQSMAEGALAYSNTLNAITFEEGITVLSTGVLKYCPVLETVQLPQSLTAIGKFAFSHDEYLEEMTIPAAVNSIGDGAFEYCDYLTGLTVAPGNVSFTTENSEDGNVLYTADGKELVAAPGLFHNTYSIPEGTETIRDFAFAGSYTETINDSLNSDEERTLVGYGLIQIQFPSSLKKIGDASFYACNRLEAIDLPERLEYIGICAFGNSMLSNQDSMGIELERNYQAEIRIGKNVRWVGQKAFASYDVGSFFVAADNWYYSSQGGILMNKTGSRSIDVL